MYVTENEWIFFLQSKNVYQKENEMVQIMTQNYSR